MFQRMKFALVAGLVGCASSSSSVADDDVTGSDVPASARLADYEARARVCLEGYDAVAAPNAANASVELDRTFCMQDAVSKLVGRDIEGVDGWYYAVCKPRVWVTAHDLHGNEADVSASRCTVEGWKKVASLVKHYAKLDGGEAPPAAGPVASRCKAPSVMLERDAQVYRSCVIEGMQEVYVKPLLSKIQKNPAAQTMIESRVAVAVMAGGGTDVERSMCARLAPESTADCLNDWLAVVEDGVADLVR